MTTSEIYFYICFCYAAFVITSEFMGVVCFIRTLITVIQVIKNLLGSYYALPVCSVVGLWGADMCLKGLSG